jgi:GNAT superfamily N-acetyltransferase
MKLSPVGHPPLGLGFLEAEPVAALPRPESGPYTPADLGELARRGGTRFFLAAGRDVSLDHPDQNPPDYALGLTWELANPPDPEKLQAAYQAGVRLINWASQASPADPVDQDAALATLRDATKAGLWNHLQLPSASGRVSASPLRLLNADHPHLAHSLGGPPAAETPLAWSPPQTVLAPKGFPPLPETPLWAWLGQPALLLPSVVHYGMKELRCLRVRADGSLRRLGSQLEYHFVKPQQVPQPILERIIELILAGGKMKPGALKENLHNAFLVNYVLEGEVLVATSTIKRPRPEYVQKVKQLTGIDFRLYLERGYIVVRPEYRGLGVGDYLIQEAKKRWQGKNTFLAIGADNLTGQEITKRNGGRLLVSYFSQEMNKEIGIWTPADQDDQAPESGFSQRRDSKDQ